MAIVVMLALDTYDPAILELTSGFLTDDYHVLTPANGKEALQTMKDYKGELSLLLSDFEMPGMSGMELATQLAAATQSLADVRVPWGEPLCLTRDGTLWLSHLSHPKCEP